MRYFFHVYHQHPDIDTVGEELPDRHAAWKEATITAGQMPQSLDGNSNQIGAWKLRMSLPIHYM
jgi:hypothetical protein